MLMKVIIEGIGLSAILFILCAVGIRNGAVGMVHLYHKDVQDRCVELDLTTHEQIRKRAEKGVVGPCGREQQGAEQKSFAKAVRPGQQCWAGR